MDAVKIKELEDYVRRIEALEVEKQSTTDDIKDVYATAKAKGYDTKALRKVISRRKLDKAERDALDDTVELYEGALL